MGLQVSLCLLLALSCESSDTRRAIGTDSGGGTGTGGGGEEESSGDGESANTVESSDNGGEGEGEQGPQCAETGFPIAVQPVDMLLVLDRSSSMDDNGYWAPMCQALRTVTAQISDRIHFGLMVFPQSGCDSPSGSCEPATSPLVDIGASDAVSQIDAILSPSGIGHCALGGTPTAETLKVAKTTLDAVNGTNKRYVLLATDGAPNCNPGLSCATCTVVHDMSCGGPTHCLDDLATEAAAKALFDAGYPVYVLGIGNLAKWQKVMNAIAKAGGTNQYFPSSDTGSFLSTLETITSAVASCEFDVSWDDLPGNASRDPALVNIYCKATEAEEASADNIIKLEQGCESGQGWDWVDSDTLRLCESACAKVRGGECKVVTATFGCETVVI
jgi:hypothetical protein